MLKHKVKLEHNQDNVNKAMCGCDKDFYIHKVCFYPLQNGIFHKIIALELPSGSILVSMVVTCIQNTIVNTRHTDIPSESIYSA